MIGEEKILLVGFVTSFLVVLLATPALIKVAEKKMLVDEPDEKRKLHKVGIPSVGGIIIFAATLFSYALWFPAEIQDGQTVINADLKYVVATLLVLFFVGIKDDIIGTSPVKKLVAHFIVGLILVTMADIRLTSMHGLFGIQAIPEWASIFLSLFTYIVISNAFNLIDGVDGLAAGIGLIVCVAFGIWFFIAGELTYASLAFSLGGALLSFLIFNFYPAKIFMGDSGALIIGLIVSILAIKMIEFPRNHLPPDLVGLSKPVFAIAVLIYPLFDTLRIFINRTVKGQSPFSPDNKHMHHRLLKIGLSQRQAVLVLYAVNIFIISLAIFTMGMEASVSLYIVGGVAIVLAQIPFFIKKKFD
ncbi:undecaprenyl/decaprenyl-phosphate alpha-N-acetylglucosaminyl 1-phosphate transferase [Flavobacteriales bacterium AH-315-E23]|nr:undecaprenyl/decaprenyl-phosphate alpha-N-acetylglucosaminyl 1-phosphate transferase [Flavobacteriales bacterium AH-315-E23]